MILHGRIDDKQSTTIIGQLLYLELKDSSKPIKMMINSGGGAGRCCCLFTTVQCARRIPSELCSRTPGGEGGASPILETTLSWVMYADMRCNIDDAVALQSILLWQSMTS